MNRATSAAEKGLSAIDCLWLLHNYRKRWLVPAAIVAIAAAAYAIVKPDTWTASQPLVIRSEAVGKDSSLGKFRQIEDMKTAQETLLELLRSRTVLADALAQVGMPNGYRKPASAFPDAEDIETLRKRVRLIPPKGAEFGKTEVFYLEVHDTSRQRAVALCRALGELLQQRYRHLRDIRAQSMIDELVKAAQLARADLEASTARLSEIEQQLGADLAEVRALQDPSYGDSALRRTLTEITAELRGVQAAIQADEQLLDGLKTAHSDPQRLLAMPSRLTASQPALQKLKEGLIEAQLSAARMEGKMTPDHPLVRAAREAANRAADHLRAELPAAIEGLELELRVNRQRQSQLVERLAEVDARLQRVAALRASYTALAAENRNRLAVLEKAEQNLADARAALASANATSLIAPLEEPTTPHRPQGPGRLAIVLMGLCGGLLVGLGVVYLTAPASGPHSPAPASGPQIPALADVDHRAEAETKLRTTVGTLQNKKHLTLKQALAKLDGNGTAVWQQPPHETK